MLTNHLFEERLHLMMNISKTFQCRFIPIHRNSVDLTLRKERSNYFPKKNSAKIKLIEKCWFEQSCTKYWLRFEKMFTWFQQSESVYNTVSQIPFQVNILAFRIVINKQIFLIYPLYPLFENGIKDRKVPSKSHSRYEDSEAFNSYPKESCFLTHQNVRW